MMDDNKKYLTASMDDIVFDERNKNYGAYFLRQLLNKNTIKGLMWATGLSIVFISLSFANLSFLKKDSSTEIITTVNLEEPPPLNDEAPPPPPPPPPPPTRPTIKFVEYQAKKDELVNEDTIIAIEDIKDQEIAEVTQEGDPNADNIIEEPQITVSDEPVVDDKQIFKVVEQMPEFPGGDKAMYEWLGKNIRYPKIAKDNGIEGKVYVQFVVEKDGSITDVKLARGIGGGCDEEAIDKVKNMPKWKPGKQQGKAVRVSYTLPVLFKLQK